MADGRRYEGGPEGVSIFGVSIFGVSIFGVSIFGVSIFGSGARPRQT